MLYSATCSKLVMFVYFCVRNINGWFVQFPTKKCALLIFYKLLIPQSILLRVCILFNKFTRKFQQTGVYKKKMVATQIQPLK